MDKQRLLELSGLLQEKAPPGMEHVVKALKKKYPGDMKKVYSIAWAQYNSKNHKKLNEGLSRLKALAGINESKVDDTEITFSIGHVKSDHEKDVKSLVKKLGGKLHLNVDKSSEVGESKVSFKEHSWAASNAKVAEFKKEYKKLQKGTELQEDVTVDTWFERDRKMVMVKKDDDEVVTWWDEEVDQLIDDGFLNPRDIEGSAIEYARELGLLESSETKPLPDHEYHNKTDEELKFIIKDAGEAAKAMKGHDEKAEAKYLDQVNDASTILHYRKKLKKISGVNEAQLPKEIANKVFHSEPKVDDSGDNTDKKTDIAPNGVESVTTNSPEVKDVDDRNHKTVEKEEKEKVKVDSEVIKHINQRISELKSAIELYDDKGYNDKSIKQTALDALEKIKSHLEAGTKKDVQDAKIFFTTLMSPITDMLPPKLGAFIAKMDNGMQVLQPSNALKMKEVKPYETERKE